ncbi:hypothetical protein ACFC08_18055 [Streptomyces sp. NPDC056112]|uniref:hypothetical protein n=1 Tax=Streptomyces sp. NPDC056112 TaxID=3345715 RepID=UPI0035E228D8
MTDRLTPDQEAEIDARAAHLYEYSTRHDSEWDTLAGEDVPALLAELAAVRAERDQAQAETAEFASRVNELESRVCECEPAREHRDFKRPAFYQHEAHCPVNQEAVR